MDVTDSAGPDKTSGDDIRRVIAGELEKQNPKAECVQALVLLAEPSVRTVRDGESTRYDIVDSKGELRTKQHGSETVPFTLRDLAVELRANYPTLFRAEEPPPLLEDAASAEDAPKTRDWLFLGPEEHASPEVNETDSPAAEGSRPANRGVGLGSLRVSTPQVLETLRGVSRLRLSLPPLLPPRLNLPPLRPPRLNFRPSHALYGAAALALIGLLAYGLSGGDAPPPTRAETPPPAKAAEPSATASVEPPAALKPQAAGALTGVPEVVDTSTLRINGKIVRLLGVEWARGGQAEDLTRYLSGREVACKPTNRSDLFRCEVDGRDLSEVVLFNGGARTTAEATPEMKALEAQARAAKVGVWSKP